MSRRLFSDYFPFSCPRFLSSSVLGVCPQAISDLENSSKDLAADLKDLYISSVKEVEVGAGKKALLVFVPFRLHKKFQKINSRIVRELEKKFANKHVLFIAQRTIMSKSVRYFSLVILPCMTACSVSWFNRCPLRI